VPQRRPVSVTIIGLFWKLIGITYFLGGLTSSCVIMNPAMLELMNDARPGAESSWRIGLVLLSVSGGFVWYSADGFLKLRPWARISIEMISWLALATFIGFGVYLITLLKHQPEVFFAGLGAPMGPVMSAICATGVVLLLAMIGLLRGTTIREAVQRGMMR